MSTGTYDTPAYIYVNSIKREHSGRVMTDCSPVSNYRIFGPPDASEVMGVAALKVSITVCH